MRRLLAAMLVFLLLGCAAAGGQTHQDGVYRGFYYHDALEQVAVQFELEDGVFKSVVLRSLNDRQGSLLDEDASMQRKDNLEHFTVLCNHLVGKGVDAINDLYAPEEILSEAGHRSSDRVPYEKLISALWDGLNRRPFKLVDTTKLPMAAPYADGTYRGTYIEGGREEVVLEFTISQGCFTEISYRALGYKGEDYLSQEASPAVRRVASQFEALLAYLVGKPISAVNELYRPEEMVPDVDGFSGATIRAPKVISAIWDALGRHTYTLE